MERAPPQIVERFESELNPARRNLWWFLLLCANGNAREAEKFSCYAGYDAEPYAAKVVAAGHLLMGDIFLKKNDDSGAIKEFQEYLRIDPKVPAADQIREMIPKIQAAMKKQS